MTWYVQVLLPLPDYDAIGMQGCVQLRDWTELVDKAHGLLMKYTKQSDGQPGNPSLPGGNVTKKLLESVMALKVQGGAEKILCNVQAAAMEVGVLLQVCFLHSFLLSSTKMVSRVAGK